MDVSGAVRMLRWAAPVAALVMAGLWVQPDWVTAPATRIVQHRTEFIEPAPFDFVLLNDRMEVAAGDPFVVTVETQGDELPASVTLESGNGRFRMERVKPHVFRHTSPPCATTLTFNFWPTAGGLRTTPCSLRRAHVGQPARGPPPPYTGCPSRHPNQGDVTVPEGTPIQWTMQVHDADSSGYVERRVAADHANHGQHLFSPRRGHDNSTYWITPINAQLTGDSLRHRIRVRDGKPSIRVEESQDSTSRKRCTSPVLSKTTTASAGGVCLGSWGARKGRRKSCWPPEAAPLLTKGRVELEFPRADAERSTTCGTCVTWIGEKEMC